MYYQIRDAKRKTPLHIVNAHSIYKNAKTMITTLIQTVNIYMLKSEKNLPSDLAKYMQHLRHLEG